MDERGIRDAQVVLDQLQLGDPELGEEDLVRIRKAHLDVADVEHGEAISHLHRLVG